ncbi:MAG TPA: GMC family oxidoreductase [Acidimicrobiales bacterium]|nr:GMC family oxidoreductase [Acidimicrobiales bacterium]
MLIDARDVADGATLEADLCVVGAGAAGITIARELVDASVDVLLLESGGFEADTATQALYEGEMIGTPFINGFDPNSEIDLDVVRLRFFGGTTNHWAGWCRPFDAVDFERREGLAVSGWPISRAELDPWYERAHQVIRLGPVEYDWAYWADQGLPPAVLDSDLISTRAIQVKWPFSFGEVYRADLEAAGNVSVCTHANVVRFDTNPEGTEVRGARVAILDGGPRFVARARAYVLATGGIEVPRVLLASNEANPAGLGNQHDLVGRHFTEHLLVPAGFAVLHTAQSALGLFLDNERDVDPEGAPPGQKISVRAALTVSEQARRELGLLGCELSLTPGPVAAGAPRQDDGATSVDVSALLGAVEGADAGAVAYVQCESEQTLDPASRVTIDPRDRDPLGVPRVRVDWRVGAEDRRGIQRALALLATELGRTGVGRLQAALGGLTFNPDVDEAAGPLALYESTPADAVDDFPVAQGFHHMCTARMADDPRQGVVDADGKVHGVANLWIGGSAVFATGGANTPTLTITALALRLADHLRRQVLR